MKTPCTGKLALIAFVVALIGLSCRAEEVTPAGAADGQIAWQAWSPDVFAQAKAQHRLVLLDLEAVWCHWCHVMDEKTYRDPAVVRLIRDHYLAVRVDQDSRPDLSDRYGDYGWPATILFTVGGNELARRRGYLPPEEMSSILEAFVKDPTPGPSVLPETRIAAGSSPSLAPTVRAALEKSFRANYDAKEGGWGFAYKTLDWDCVEYAMRLAQHGDVQAARMARDTLAAEVHLLDPAWGGVYQYSTDGDWAHPHFEKLMQFQAGDLRIYSLASTLWPEDGDLAKARAIEHFVATFLTSPDGVFYTSQDADVAPGRHSAAYFALDDENRRKQGVPRVDTHIYARENGWYIQGLVALANATGDHAPLEKATHAAQWIEQQRALPGGGFRHDATDAAGPYLGDTLAMGRAFLALYGATADRAWLARAEQAAQFIDAHFRAPPHGEIAAGYVTSASPVGGVFTARPLPDENIDLVRFTNLLFHNDGDKRCRAMAQFAMSYLASPGIVQQSHDWPAGLLLADNELNSDPLHVTVVGSKSDPKARALFQAARALPGSYNQTEWFDPREGPLPSSDVSYPSLKFAAAFLCTDGSCSSPQTNPAALKAMALRRSSR